MISLPKKTEEEKRHMCPILFKPPKCGYMRLMDSLERKREKQKYGFRAVRNTPLLLLCEKKMQVLKVVK